jgi:hypothetical protein
MSDLAGNAMSLSVVSACMLAAITAKQFRQECQEEWGKQTKKKGTPAPVIINKVAKSVLNKSAIATDDVMKVEKELKEPEGSDCMKTFAALSEISEEVRMCKNQDIDVESYIQALLLLDSLLQPFGTRFVPPSLIAH